MCKGVKLNIKFEEKQKQDIKLLLIMMFFWIYPFLIIPSKYEYLTKCLFFNCRPSCAKCKQQFVC